MERTAEAETVPVKPASLPLPDRPSIAVLAFGNLSGDREQEYFADGIAEDIITDLSRLSGLFVIARNSSFHYKGKPARIPQIAQELGIRYVLEGSVRRAGDIVRVNAQLIDATTGGHLWAERYDRSLRHIFEIQDDISQRIVDALAAKLVSGHDSQLVQGTRNVDAYDSYLKGWSHLRRTTPDDTAEAVKQFGAAIEWDADFSRAHAALAAAYLLARRFQWHRSLGLASQYDAETLAARHIELAMVNPSAPAFRVRAELHYREGRYRSALQDLAEARKRDPNDAVASAQLGLVYVKMGRAEDAIDSLRAAMRLDPNQPLYAAMLGVAEFARGRFAEAAQWIEDAVGRNPEDHAHLDHLIAAYAYLGRDDEARSRTREMNVLRTKAGIEPYTLFVAAKSPLYANDCDLFRLREGLRRAGVPAGPEPEPPVSGANCAPPSVK